jgi:hypothetical protein
MHANENENTREAEETKRDVNEGVPLRSATCQFLFSARSCENANLGGCLIFSQCQTHKCLQDLKKKT